MILKNESDIQDIEIAIKETDIIIKLWSVNGIPEWWTVYNEIKHNRNEIASKINPDKKYYQLANQKNVLLALAALFSLEMYAYKLLAVKNDEKLFVPALKTIFTIKNLYWKDVIMENGVVIDKRLGV